MDASHALAYDGHMDASGPSAADMTHLSLDFGAIMASDHALAHGLGPFEACIHDDSCLDNHHHFRQPKTADKLHGTFAQPLHPHAPRSCHAPVSTPRSQGQPLPRQQPFPPTAEAPALYQAQVYAWDSFFNDSSLDDPALQPGSLAARRDDDCASECSSVCDGSCPSQCGDTGHGVCCDDDACGSPQLCLDQDCRGASKPCTDENCLAESTSLGKQMAAPANPSMTDGDKAAAAALASFGDNQLQLVQGGFMQSPDAPPPPSRDATLSFMGLPASLPCGSLSMESMLTDGPPSFPDQPYQMAFEYALASHIMQHHDPSHGLAHTGACVANDPSQLISRCTLPKFSPNDSSTDPYLSQLQGHECGFQVQDPNAFAHHILEEHRPALVFHSQQFRLPDARAHAGRRASHQHRPRAACHVRTHMAAHGKPFSPSPSPLTTLSIGPSLSATPSSLATPSPLESDAGLTELNLGGALQSPAGGPKVQILTQEDQFLCRWMTGDGDSISICGSRFDNDEQLQKHCKAEHLKQLKKVRGGFRCGWANCTRNTCFTQRSKVERHMQVHTGYKPVHCDICGAALSAKQALDQHMRIHTGETPWMCKFPGCGCAFKQQSALTMHERTHTGDKPLECEICHKRFSESSNLSKHRRTHNVKGMHECQLCGKDFHRLDQLRRHMGTNHKDRPAEVDALLSRAKSKMQAQKVLKPKKTKAGAGLQGLNADTLELIEDHFQGVMMEQESP